jgi:DNA repair exonuclease SbcCD ATPase subunit
MNPEQKQRLIDLHRKYVSAVEGKEREKNELKKAIQNHQDAITAQGLIQEVAKNIQEKTHKQIIDVVSQCLQTVFGDKALGFQILFDKKRGKTEARAVFIRNGLEEDPETASAGGMIDVASFALRLCRQLLIRPAKRRLLVLDEPFRFVSAEYRPALKTLIEDLSKQLQFQIILVTHDKEFEAGKIIQLGKKIRQ